MQSNLKANAKGEEENCKENGAYIISHALTVTKERP